MADVAFTAYGFKPDIGSYAGTDTRLARNMPTRLKDIINVKDWGAIADGVTDDTAAIQAAIDFAYNTVTVGKGCIVFFPAGTYRIGTPPLRLNPPTVAGKRIKLIGVGRDVTILRGTYSTGNYPTGNQQIGAVGFLLQSNYTVNDIVAPSLIQSLTIWNDSTDPSSGALYYAQTQGPHQRLIDCRLIANQGVFLCENTFGGYIRNCIAQCGVAYLSANNADIRKGALPNSVGYAFDQGVMINNIADGYDFGFALMGADASTGNASMVTGCKAIRCNNGFSLGLGSKSVTGQANNTKGIWLTSNTAERCGVGVFINNAGGCLIAANVITGEEGPATAAQIQNMTWSSAGGGTVEVTTTLNHGISLWPYSIFINVTPAAWTPNGTGKQARTVTVTAANKFTYTGVGSSPPTFVSGTWNYTCQVGITTAQGGANTFAGNSFKDSSSDFAGYDFTVIPPNAPFGPGEVQKMVAMCMNGNFWNFHDGINPGANWQFIQCYGGNFAPYIKFAGLQQRPQPSGAGRQRVQHRRVLVCRQVSAVS